MKKVIIRVAIFVIVLLCSAEPVIGRTFTVTSTANEGDGSLAWAIAEANTSAGADTIEFAIPKTDANYIERKGIWQTTISTTLPAITDDSTFIDGDSQARNIEDSNRNGMELVVYGIQAPVELPGIWIQSAYNKISGLSIGGFRGPTFLLQGTGAHDNLIENCHIGIDANGKFGYNARHSLGVVIEDGAHHNIIGGAGAGKRNIISGFYYEAIKLTSAHHNKIIGNYIGVTGTGIAPLGNGWGDYDRQDYTAPLGGRFPGIFIKDASRANQIGGAQPGEGNVICASGRPGIRIESVGSDSNIVQGNYIGVGADGETALPNGEAGLWLSRGPAYNLIGGEEPGAGNVISGNYSSGIQMRQASHHNKLAGNYIGTNATATRLIPNSHNGIYFFGQYSEGYPQYNEIGPGNIIIANGEEGEIEKPQYTWGAIRMDSSGTAYNVIYGNYLGTNSTGTLASEWNSGIIIGSGAHDNVIGPDNVIANNHKYGVWIRQEKSVRNTITKNMIYNNGIGQILLESGGNEMIEAPVILSASESGVSGTTVPFGIVEIFSGKNQAEKFLAQTQADSAGQFNWQSTSQEAFVTATVTDTSGNTSMLSESASLPVELSLFVARSEKGGIRLVWRTETETNNFGFYIQRKTAAGIFREIAFVPGAGTINTAQEYEYFDSHAPQRATLRYRLRQVDFDGRQSFSQEIVVATKPVTTFSLSAPYPNPFNAGTMIKYSLPSATTVRLQVFNVQGQLVRTLVNKTLQAGEQTTFWDGLDDNGAVVPSGQYFIVLKAGSQQSIRKIVLQK